tara:strand:- start:928 stop:1320 length:393 start_codon:yes stop_codon:yes gene_type:complete
MKTLDDVAFDYVKVARKLIIGSYPGWKKAPFDTGNLYRTISSFNIPQRMRFTQKGKSFITLNYAPPGARYGTYVEKGTSRMPSRPFAMIAANSQDLKRSIFEYEDGKVQEVRDEVQKRMTVIFAPFNQTI